jgi:hypothetical protein
MSLVVNCLEGPCLLYIFYWAHHNIGPCFEPKTVFLHSPIIVVKNRSGSSLALADDAMLYNGASTTKWCQITYLFQLISAAKIFSSFFSSTCFHISTIDNAPKHHHDTKSAT